MKKLFIILTGLFLAACAPVISKDVLKEVDATVRFDMLLGNPDQYVGRTVLLGGEIIETQPVPEKTLIMVLQRPLVSRDKPSREGTSEGRFIVSSPGFLDPAIYRTGRQITVAGEVTGKEVRPLGKIDYTYPVIERKELHLWPLDERAQEPRLQFGIGIGIGKTF
jgi:outer membrane lipoprotein